MEKEESNKRGDADAKQWASNLAARFGEAVHFYRNRLGLSAVQLSARTKEIGYPITRGAIAKIEGNHRNGKIDVSEVLALAAALDVAPIDLIFPGFPQYGTFALPKFITSSQEAQSWFSSNENYEPFGKVNHPRNDTSKALRQRTAQLAQAIKEVEKKIELEHGSLINPSSLSLDEAKAILVDLAIAKLDIEKLGGNFAGTSWDWHLKELVEDPSTEWRPF